MKFYIKPTEEHPNEQKKYALIREGILKLFTGEDYDKTPENERLSKDLSQEYEIVEFEVKNELKTKAFKVILEGSSTYKQKPLEPDIITQPCIYTSKANPQRLRFPKHNQKNANIGIIKAYKKDKNTHTFLEDFTGLNNPHNEIYTLDTEQTIQLKAFIYEEQRTYVERVTNEDTEIRRNHALQQGNITKTIITDKSKFNDIAEEEIHWAFKIVNDTYLAEESNTRTQAFPELGDKQTFRISNENVNTASKDSDNESNISPKLTSVPQGYVILEDKTGDCITLKLSDIFDERLFNPNNQETLINKNIIFFAYDKNVGINQGKDFKQNAYRIYQDNRQSGSKKEVLQDRITSIELKILKTRFSLEFNGKSLLLLENERKLGEWEARSGIPIDPIDDVNKESKRNRFKIQDFNTNKFYYYDDETNKEPNDRIHTDSTKPLAERSYTITTTHNPEQFNIHNIDLLGLQNDFCTLLKLYEIPQGLSIPLKVSYQKRILIFIERFKQTTESTKARMNIYIDGKRINSNGEITKKSFAPIDDEINPYAYILERPGPDSIGGKLKLRVPSGRYNTLWHKEKDVSELKEGEKAPWNANTLNLYNNFVAQGRTILIHSGNSPKNSDGCLLINQNPIFKDKIEIDNVLQAGKKDILAQHIKNKFTKAILGKMTSNIEEFVEKHIEIRIENAFKRVKEKNKIPILSNSQERKQSIIYNTPAIFNIEGYEQNTSNDVPWYQRHTQEEVTENSKTIDSIIDKNIYTNTINHNRLIRAIIYIETTHGYYDKIYDIPVIQDIVVKYYGNQKSFTPMNVNYDYWKELADKMGYTKEQVKSDKETNITIGYELIKRIIDRIENPTIEKIGTLYNSLAKEKISSYGRILKYYYDNKSWLNLKPPSMQDLLNHIKDNPPSIKGF